MSLRPVEKLYPYRGHVRTVEPAAEPVTAAELRAHLADTETGLPDAIANSFIAVSRSMLEEATGLAFITQTWRQAYDRWPSDPGVWWDGVRDGAIGAINGPSSTVAVLLPRYPLQEIDAVSVFASDGTETAVVVANTFDVDVYQKPGRMALKYGKTWPVSLRPVNGIQIDYIAGYGDAGADVPEAIKLAIKMMAGHLYAHRGDGCSTHDAMSQSGALAIVGQYKAARL